MKDVKCPYCGEEQDINHEDGYGYSEGETFHQECKSCGKSFAYETQRIFHYDVRKADCLNKHRHKWHLTTTIPKCATRMMCPDCGEYRELTKKERKKYNIPTYEEYFDELDRRNKQ
jgi:predicted RNA-binding Zn-ribbon protein involved in translation (DUF1610 family)